MAHVIVLDSLNEDIFVCGLCKSVFNSLTLFVDHKRQNCINELFVANILHESDVRTVSSTNCTSFENSTPDTAVVPLQEICQHKNDEKLMCKLCSKQYTNVKSLQTHMKTHSEKLHQCSLCGRCFSQNSHLQRHINCHKVWPEGITETTPKSSDVELLSYSCSYCDTILSNYSQFRVHLKIHLSLKKFKCVQSRCTEFFDTFDSLLQHVIQTHPVPVYNCHICNENFNTLDSIASHQQCHQSVNKGAPKFYKCMYCDAVFKSSEKLSLHMVTESHIKTCVHCNKTFVSDKRLRMHLQIHKKIKLFHCNICKSSFSLKKYLMTHMLRHGNKQFKCSICKNMFKRQDLLQRHMRLHQMKKMFLCPFKETLGCQKEFSRKDKLQLHVKCHSKLNNDNSK